MLSITKWKYSVHGISRVIPGIMELAQTLKCKEISAFIITREEIGTPKEHIHFFCQSDNRHCNRTWIRKLIVDKFNLKITKNGQLNLDKKVKDCVQAVTYLTKEGYPEIVHNYPSSDIKTLSRMSYSKKISMTTAIKRLLSLVSNSQLTPEEYTVEYRLCRIKYRKPDPNWQRQYLNAEEQQKTELEIRTEVSDFKNLRYKY